MLWHHDGATGLSEAAWARDLHASEVGLVAPYFPYLRQGAAFHPGEAVSAPLFAGLVSSRVDWLVTVDPHLHRTHDLQDLFPIPADVVQSAPLIAAWIRLHVARPLIVGPDQESAQWVAGVAADLDAPWVVMTKRRLGDHRVELNLPTVRGLEDHQPVLVDDIVASGGTVRAAARLLAARGFARPWVVAVHAVADRLTTEMPEREARLELATCSTIHHTSNRIDVSEAVRLTVSQA